MAILKNLARPSTVVGGAQTPNKKGSGFTNLNRIIQSNKDNKLSSAVAGGIQQTGQQVQEQTQQAQQKFQEEAQKSRLDTQEAKDKRSGILGRFGQPQQTQAQTTGVNQENLPNQQQPIVSEDEIKDFTRFRTGTYTGPKELENMGSLQGKAAQAEQVGDLARSTGGRQELLRRFVGGQGYTQGQQRLDTTLLGQGGQEEMNRARRGLRTMEEDVARAGMASRGLAQEYVGRAKEFGQETGQMIQQTRDPISTGIDTRLKDLQDAEAKRIENLNLIRRYLADDKTLAIPTSTEQTQAPTPVPTQTAPAAPKPPTIKIGKGGGGNRLSNIASAVSKSLAASQPAPAPQQQFKISDLDKTTRLGIGLDMASKMGVLSQDDLSRIQRENLLGRGMAAGVDLNTLFNERLQDIAAQNLTREGVATDQDRAQLSALDRLAGKVGTDVEFGADTDRFKAGSSKFDIDSLKTYIEQTEAEKARTDAAYAAQLEKEKAKYINQVGANLESGVGGTVASVGNYIDGVTDLSLNKQLGAMGKSVNAAADLGNASIQAQLGILDQLINTSMGGKKLLGDNASRELSNLVRFGSDATNKAIAAGKDITGTFTDLGTYERMVGDFLKAPGNIAKSLGSGVGNAVKSFGKALKKLCFTGDVKVLMADGRYKKVSDLKLGDDLALGGKITFIGQSEASDTYILNGVKVTGYHVVFYKGKWMEVKNVPDAYPVGKEDVVYPISTEMHLMVTENQIWSDYDVVEGGFSTHSDEEVEEQIEQLNSNKARNYKLLKFEKEYFKKK